MKTKAKKVNFLDLDAELTGYRSSRFAILPIPYEGTVCYGAGTAAAPQAIIDASTQVELFDEELKGEFYKAGIYTTQPVDCKDAKPEQIQQCIENTAGNLLADGKFVLALGGEHSVSFGLVKAAAKRWPGLSVLHLDAHADLRDSYQDSKYSHACVMRRITELHLPPVSVGIRSYSLEESELVAALGDRLITARQIAQARADRQAAQSWLARALAGLTEEVYVTIDIDVFDPGQVPGTGTPEPGGLDWYEVTALLRHIAQNRQVVSADIVEVVPRVAGQVAEFLAARLAYKIIAYSQRR